MQEAIQYHPLPASFTPEQRDELFQQILLIYEYLDKVLACVTADNIKNRTAQMNLVIPFVTQAKNAANVLAEFYVQVAKKNKPVTPDMQSIFEGAFRVFFEALKEFSDGVERTLS